MTRPTEVREVRWFRDTWLLGFLLPLACGEPGGGAAPGDPALGAAGQAGATSPGDLPANTGGAPTNTGGAPSDTGGAPASTGGAPASTGGAPQVSSGGSGGVSAAGGMAGSTSAAGNGGTTPLPERVWVDRVMTWTDHTRPDQDEPNVISNWASPVNYVAGQLRVRIKVEQIGTEQVFHELCVVDSRGPDHFICFRCPAGSNAGATGITTTGEITCTVSPTNCTSNEAGWGHCYGGNYFYARRPVRTWHRIRSEAHRTTNGSPNLGCNGPHCADRGGFLDPRSLPFKARITVVLVPARQTFSGWQNYP